MAMQQTKKHKQKQRSKILAGFGGTVLLVSSVALYILEMHVIEVIGGIIGFSLCRFCAVQSFKVQYQTRKS